jgi:hypothetical protein
MATMSRSKLSKQMTLRQFDHGYWYAMEIKRFAQSLGLLRDFMAANPGATMAAAMRAWKTVKTMDSPKNYRPFARTHN